jgi:large subunit ribosomal protein L9
MEVILLEKIGRLGHMGDRVKVKDGYARNYLIPAKKALRATKSNMEFFELQRAGLEKKSAEARTAAEAVAALVAGKSFVVIRQAGDTGRLYGSVSTRDIAGVLKSGGADVDYAKIAIDTPIKSLGIYSVKVALHPEIVEVVKINVARSEAEAKVAEENALLEAQKAAEKKARKDAAKAEEAAAALAAEEEAVESADAAAEEAAEPAASEPAEEGAPQPAKKSARKKAAEPAAEPGVEPAAEEAAEAPARKKPAKKAAGKKAE